MCISSFSGLCGEAVAALFYIHLIWSVGHFRKKQKCGSVKSFFSFFKATIRFFYLIFTVMFYRLVPAKVGRNVEAESCSYALKQHVN